MVEPKIEKTEKKEEKGSAKETAEQPPAVTPEAARYWDYVQRTRLLEVSKVAVFTGEGGLVIVPLDRLGRVLLDSALFLPLETLDVLADSMNKLVESGK